MVKLHKVLKHNHELLQINLKCLTQVKQQIFFPLGGEKGQKLVNFVSVKIQYIGKMVCLI